MDILIIGNGFDLAHGLRTSYKDFLKFCQNIDNIDHEVNPCFKDCCQKNLWMKHFITRQNELGDTWIDLEKEIYQTLRYIRSEINAIKNFLHREKFIPVLQVENSQEFNFKNIQDFVRRPYYDEKDIIANKDNKIMFWGDSVCLYIRHQNDLIDFLYEQLREFTKTFEIYLVEIIQKNIDGTPYVFSLKEGIISQTVTSINGLSFNYTDTCERLYNPKYNSYSKYSIKPIYVHGKAGSCKTCNLVFGTYSFKNKNNEEPSFSIPVELNVFKKYHQRHRYGTIEAYQQLLREIKDYNREVTFHIVGHSLDETDRIILEHILNANKNSIIKIYYHDEESHVRLINNIEEIIGEKDVMARVQFIYQHDPKRGILRKLNGTA